MEEHNPLAANYGDIPLEQLSLNVKSGREWKTFSSLSKEIDKPVLIRGQLQVIRIYRERAFLILREGSSTVQCVLNADSNNGGVSAQMLEYAKTITEESFVDVEGIVTVPTKPITGTSEQVEVQVTKIYCVNRANKLPFCLRDAARSEQAGEQSVRVNQDTCLKNRVVHLRTPANHAIFTLVARVAKLYRHFLDEKDFVEIFTPKIIAGASEGGASVFKLNYKNQSACLAQSPQLHKQMTVCGGLQRVYEIGPVFRAEDSDTHRHLCEFRGLDVEMEIKECYSEVMDFAASLFVKIFDELNKTCTKELEAIRKQFPFEPLKYWPENTLKLTFEEGVQMLKDAGVEVDPLGDLNTEAERTLGKLVFQKHKTEFYILHRYPLAVRPFYTMPCPDNAAYSNSFDVFLRGEEIISGSQRIHMPELLKARAIERGVDVETNSYYIDSFSYGAPPHGGFGAGLERVVMLFCGLDNIRKTSLFPRDPRRLAP